MEHQDRAGWDQVLSPAVRGKYLRKPLRMNVDGVLPAAGIDVLKGLVFVQELSP